MRSIRVIASARCFFPRGAFFYSTDKLASMAREVGYEGIEFLPTWRVVWEVKRYGRLLAPKEMVASGHRDWRFDRVMEAKLKGKPGWWYQLKNMEDWLFLPSGVCLNVLRKLQAEYGVPVSAAWFEDAKNFSPVMLELWSKEQGVDQKRLVEWLQVESDKRGVVVDTAKFRSWCETNEVDKEEVWEGIAPHVWEVHYRVKGRANRRMDVEARLSGESTEVLKWILQEKRWRGRVVVEFGWPDLPDNPFGLFTEDLEAFAKLNKRIVKYIRGFDL